MIKVKCIGSIMSRKYFAGETYEIPNDFYEAHKNCFIPLTGQPEENKVMTTADVETKNIADDYESQTVPDLKALADSKGIEYRGNISKTDLIELLKK